jgi:hypothetical protein
VWPIAMVTQSRRLRAIYIADLLPALLFLVLHGGAIAQEKESSPGGVYANESLGFRYELPCGMYDETQSDRAEIRARGAERHVGQTFDLLLGMTSGTDDLASGWHSLSIETYPRQALGSLDNTSAEATMSAWVAGISGSPGTPRFVVLSGQSFAVSVFGERKGTVKKGAVVWTTIRKGKLLSFAFVANSPEQLKALAETMKTVKFF